MRKLLALFAMLALAAPATAKDSLGMFSGWGAFRDPSVPRCYAIAQPRSSQRARSYQPYATIGTWPRRNLRNQLHLRLSRDLAKNSSITLSVGGQRFQLTGGGGDAWAQDRTMDAAVIAAMRSASRMSVTARDARGNRFFDTYDLAGAATAMDAATVGCARLR